jgi:hypothetical protein
MPNGTTLRWAFSMPPRVHPCLCGFACSTYAQMKRHRRKCHDWQSRPDPRGLTIARRRESKLENAKVRNYLPCPACGGRPDHHEAECPHSQGEAIRREAIVKNGINPRVFDMILREIERRFAKGGKWNE